MRNFSFRKKELLIGVIAFFILSLPLPIEAQILSDQDDVFEMHQPAPNSQLSGSSLITWRAYDDDQASIETQITLRDSDTCVSQVAVIFEGMVNANSTSDAVVSWKTGGPLVDVSVITDGNYCLQTCMSLLKGSQPYSSCNLRVINIRNNNRNPIINSAPPSDKTINPADSWQYQLQTSDADGDLLAYALTAAPNFLAINPTSGLIRTNEQVKAPGKYVVTVVVQDGYGGSVSQTFELTVTDPVPDTPLQVNEPATISIQEPNSDNTFAGETNEVKWTAEDPEEVSSQVISYSTDSQTWVQVAEVGASIFEYNWDVTNLEDGTYFLMIAVRDKEGVTTARISDQFTIDNQKVSGEFVTRPLIVNVFPTEGSIIKESRPAIKGEFTPPASSDINPASFRFYVNSEDRVQFCEVNEQAFNCELDSELKEGTYKIRAEIRSTDGQGAIREWVVTVDLSSTTGASTVGGGFNIQTLVIILCILGLLLLLLGIPWLLYLIWRRSESSAGRFTFKPEEEKIIPTPRQPKLEAAPWDKPSIDVIVAEPEVITEEIPQPAVETSLDIDPSQFESYPEYLAAVSKQKKQDKKKEEKIDKKKEEKPMKAEEKEIKDIKTPEMEGKPVPPETYLEITPTEDDRVDVADDAFAPGWLQVVSEDAPSYGQDAQQDGFGYGKGT